MLPAFPMDGGRVLRALLATRLPYTRATRIASYFGQGMALLFALGGLFGNPFLLFIAFFVWIGAAQEFAAVEAKSALGGLAVGGAMITDYRHLNPSDTLSRAVDLVLSGSQQDFPVVDDERVVGILTTPDLIMALSKHGQDKKVEDVMINTVESADVSDPIESVFEKLKACDCSMMPVLKNGRLAGLITAENVSELLVIRAALSMRVGEAAGTQHLSHSR
jgi:CBS domain-containing protein